MPTCEEMEAKRYQVTCPRSVEKWWSRDCNPGNVKHGATSINTLQNSWYDYRNPERKYLKELSHQDVTLFISPSLPSVTIQRYSLSASHKGHLFPVFLHPILISGKRCVSRRAIWFLTSPSIVRSGSHQHKQKHPLPSRTQRNRQFFLWILFPEVA